MMGTLQYVKLWGEPNVVHLKGKFEDRTLCGNAQPSESAEEFLFAHKRGVPAEGRCPVCERVRAIEEYLTR